MKEFHNNLGPVPGLKESDADTRTEQPVLQRRSEIHSRSANALNTRKIDRGCTSIDDDKGPPEI